MKKEYKVLLYSMINNLIISCLKIGGGFLGKSNSLLSDGLHTFSDFVTDIFALIGSKISKKRPNKVHPFGFGRVEYITSMMIGIIILALGIFIVVKSFFTTPAQPELFVIIITVGAAILKTISTVYLVNTGKKLKSQILISSGKESLTDLYSSLGVILIILMSYFSTYVSFFRYADTVGSICVGILIVIMAFKIIKDNVLALIGEECDDKELLEKIRVTVESIKDVDLINIKLQKYGSYYAAHLTVEINPNMNVMGVYRLENKINKKIKKEKFGIKYTTIEVEPDEDLKK